MQKLIIIGFLACGMFACGNSKTDSENSPPVSGDNQFTVLRNTIENDLGNNNAVAVSIAIYKDGEVVFAEAFGEKAKDSGETVTPETLFQLGSTTKMFTALATLQLTQEGLLSMDDKLVNTMPNIQYPSVQALTWQDISIDDLLTHQSGLPDTYIGTDSNSSLVEYMSSGYPQQNMQNNPPGIFYNYSNPSWSYLGAVVEQITQTPYIEHMQQNIFEPMGMTRTWMDRSKVVADGNYALGFQANGSGGIFLSDINQIPLDFVVSPAGSETWSTPTQQLKMAEFLLNGNTDILSAELQSEMTTAKVSIEFAGLPLHYGYGIYVDDGFQYNEQWYPEKVWQHAGNTLAYSSAFWILPEKNIAVSILSSGRTDDFSATMIAALEAVTELPQAQSEPIIPSDSSEYYKHVGTYTSPVATIIVTEVNNELHISIPEMDEANFPYEDKLTPIGDKTFIFVAEEAALVTFMPAIEGDESVYFVTRDVVGIKDGY
jgi:CubicO group peptidase (beta-lactamase class C family)